jgi:hypothetical protein
MGLRGCGLRGCGCRGRLGGNALISANLRQDSFHGSGDGLSYFFDSQTTDATVRHFVTNPECDRLDNYPPLAPPMSNNGAQLTRGTPRYQLRSPL